MNYKEFSHHYQIKLLVDKDIPSILELCLSNPQYYKYCPPTPTTQTILDDMKALPPSKNNDDKYFLGYYLEDKLIAVMDFIRDYPNNDTCFIGFFMVNKENQNQHHGQTIISDLTDYLRINGYKNIRLGYHEKNLKAKSFWLNNNFLPIGIKTGKIIVLNRFLNIRKMKDEDIHRLTEIYIFDHRFFYYPIFKDINYAFKYLNIPNVTKLLKKKDFKEHTYVYEDEIIKGFITIKNKEILKCFVDCFFLHQHVGQTLVDYATSVKKANRLFVLKNNTDAINFYKHNNFILTDEEHYEGNTNQLVCLMKKINIIKYDQQYKNETITMIKKVMFDLKVDPKIDDHLLNNDCFLALLDNKVVGVIGYLKGFNREITINSLYIHPTYKHLTIAPILLLAVETHLKKNNYHTINVQLQFPKEIYTEGYFFFPKQGYKFTSLDTLVKEI